MFKEPILELLDPTMCLRIPMIDSLGTVQVDFGHLWILPLGKSQAAVQVWTGPRKALVAGPGNTANGSTNQSKADDHLILSTNQSPVFADQWGSRWSGVNITAAKTAGGESCSFSGFNDYHGHEDEDEEEGEDEAVTRNGEGGNSLFR